MSTQFEGGSPAQSTPAAPSAPAAQSASQPSPQPAAPKRSVAPWVGFGLVVVGFAIALIPLVGVVGWPLMLAGLILGIVGAVKRWQPMWANIVNIVLGFAGPGLAIMLVSSALVTGAAVTEAAGGSAAAGSSSSAGQAPAEGAAGAEEGAPESDFAVTIDGAAPGTDYEGKPTLVVTYTFTNNSDEATSFTLATMAKAFQDGVQLSNAIALDLNSEDLLKEVQPGATISVTNAFSLTSESEVTVEVTELFSLSDVVLAKAAFPAA